MVKQKIQPLFLQALKGAKLSRSTKFFYILVLTIYVIAISTFFLPPLQKLIMRKMHLTSPNFVVWGITQTIPSMYNFANEIEISAPGTEAADVFTVNHYPLRLLTFSNNQRQKLCDSPFPKYKVTLKSSYRGQTLESKYWLSSKVGRLIIWRRDE